MSNASRTVSSLYQQLGCLFSGRQLPCIFTFNMLRCNFGHQTLSSSSRHAIFVFLVPVLLNFIEIKYQGKFITPFETHPLTAMASIVSLLVYCLAFVAEQTLSSTYASISRCFMRFSSSLSLVSLALILFPESMRYALYVSYLLVSMVELYGMVQKLCSWFQKTVIAKFVSQFRSNQQLHHRRRLPLLPRTSMDVRYLQLQL